MTLTRCAWVSDDPLYLDYHDNEWGVACYDDDKLFELLILEGLQAGLSWITILKKRAAYHKALRDFTAKSLAKLTDQRIETLLTKPELIRNRRKMYTLRQNAEAYLELSQQSGSFADYLWQTYAPNGPIIRHYRSQQQVPTTSTTAKALAKDLKKRGFNFVGDTICHAYLEAVGVFNHHLTTCFCHPNHQ